MDHFGSMVSPHLFMPSVLSPSPPPTSPLGWKRRSCCIHKGKFPGSWKPAPVQWELMDEGRITWRCVLRGAERGCTNPAVVTTPFPFLWTPMPRLGGTGPPVEEKTPITTSQIFLLCPKGFPAPRMQPDPAGFVSRR